MTYTPTTEDVREAASLNGGIAVEPDAFDRWLSAHDAEIREQVAQKVEVLAGYAEEYLARSALYIAANAIRGYMT